MAFLILEDDGIDQSGLINDFIYFDEEDTDGFRSIIERYAARVREIRFERSVKIVQLRKLATIFQKTIAEQKRGVL